tara:strand:- start:1777 stop:2883 length:1107 start_codon:yes stop_codon:yes gene_type:complete
MSNYSFTKEKELEAFIQEGKFKKILIITGENSFKKSGANSLFKKILKENIVDFFIKKKSYPEIKELKKIIAKIKIFSPQLIIAVGGGSVLDYAKIANVLTNETNIEDKVINASYTTNKFTKLLGIPTTAGSGAEVTTNAVIYIDNIKYSVEGPELRPDFYFLIPELVVGGSKIIKASAGFDAIAQAIESLISKKSNKESVEFSKKSLNFSIKNYLNYLNSPNYENTSAMCFAANLSGEAISISKTTAPHAVSYPFTSIYKISHGHAVSLTLNKFLKFNYENLESADCSFDLKERFKIIFAATKTKNINELNNFLKKIKKEANLESNFDKLGINIKKDYENIISGVNLLRLSNNPITLEKKNLKKIILS